MDRIPENENDIFVIKYKRERDYTTLYNDCINDEKLCAESLAFLVYVMSKPDDWRINLKNLSNRFKVGRDKTDRAVKKLCEVGYMKRCQSRMEDGSFSKVLIYASDKPVFINEFSPPEISNPSSEKQELPAQSFTPEKTDKQPLTEIQETVIINETDKKPFPENPLTVFQETVPYIQMKDDYKENNNNKNIVNPIDARATLPSDKLNNINSDASVVVVFMKKIEGSGVPEETLVSWVQKYGSEYVAEKIRIFQSKGILTNPAGFLSSAIRYDWKEKDTCLRASQDSVKYESSKKVDVKADVNDAKNWFRYLADNEKLEHYEKAITIWARLEDMIKVKNESVLDNGFVDSPWFKPMMGTLGMRF